MIDIKTLEKLDYSALHAVALLKQSQSIDGRLCYEPQLMVKHCAFYPVGNASSKFVPCYIVSKKMPNGVELEDFTYATMKAPLGYGTYDIVPREIGKQCIGKFFKMQSSMPAFEGFFYNKMQLRVAFNGSLMQQFDILSETDTFITADVKQRLCELLKNVGK